VKTSKPHILARSRICFQQRKSVSSDVLQKTKQGTAKLTEECFCRKLKKMAMKNTIIFVLHQIVRLYAVSSFSEGAISPHVLPRPQHCLYPTNVALDPIFPQQDVGFDFTENKCDLRFGYSQQTSRGKFPTWVCIAKDRCLRIEPVGGHFSCDAARMKFVRRKTSDGSTSQVGQPPSIFSALRA